MHTQSDTSNRLLAWKHLVEAYQTCHQKYARMMSHFDLTVSQFDVLTGIESLGDKATPKEVAKRLLVTKGNITSVTRRLFERGLIHQKSHALDKRSIILELTDSGKSLLTNAKLAAKQFVAQQLAPFSQSDVDLVDNLMQQMRSHLNSKDFDFAVQGIVSQHTSEQMNLSSMDAPQ
ncbi:MAG: MarR family transcriptional regulator [Oleiphilaceae bacterium]|nr:MarR family transcriptional regulator [Oleiphilaceae bacterium]